METPQFRCEDCGHEFVETELALDREDSPLACPACGGLDLQRVEPVAPLADRRIV